MMVSPPCTTLLTTGRREHWRCMSQTRIIHILTLDGVLGIVPQLEISAITGYCYRIHSTFLAVEVEHSDWAQEERWRWRSQYGIGIGDKGRRGGECEWGHESGEERGIAQVEEEEEEEKKEPGGRGRFWDFRE